MNDHWQVAIGLLALIELIQNYRIRGIARRLERLQKEEGAKK